MLVRWLQLVALYALLATSGVGCSSATGPVGGNRGGQMLAVENPMFIQAGSVDSLWEPLVDSVDDYFQIAHEERVRQVGDILTEGRIDTYPLVSATYLEPWRRDSVTPTERLEATLQSMRRTALVRVMPANGGYLVEIQVYKEIEDVAQPEGAAIGVAEVSRAATALSLDRLGDLEPISVPGRLGWIPRGRDFALEQVMLNNLRQRLAGPPLQPLGPTGPTPWNPQPLPPPPLTGPMLPPPPLQ